MVLAVSFVAVYYGKEGMRHARLAQVYDRAMEGKITASDAIFMLDYNYNNQISVSEAGLATLHKFSSASPEISSTLGLLWNYADMNDDGQLDSNEVEIYFKRVHATKKCLDSWKQGDPLV